MKCIVDTNVPLVANGDAPQASASCIDRCARALQQAMVQQILVLDDGWQIIGEYRHRLRSSGQPGLGDAFLKWVLTNLANPQRCEMVHITSRGSQDEHDWEEFPDCPELEHFDPSDRKFVAVAVAHPEHPPILNAVDSDWWEYWQVLAQNQVRVDFVCPDAPFMKGATHG